ncbi:MAG: DUF4823 domain-containing protein [Candidatus Accumulibacter sp.]|nr:DUF4823 domain-containing protein [Accumulibacter sp.]
MKKEWCQMRADMKNRSALLFVLGVVVFIFGCATKIQHSDVIADSTSKLEKNQIVYIALAGDGHYGGKAYPGSGVQVSHFIGGGIKPYVQKTIVANAPASTEAILASAKDSGARYAFVPVISNWEPRAAAWSGIPTRVSISIAIHDVSTGQEVMLRKIDVKGRAMTFVSQSADELAKVAIYEFCANIF